MDKLEFKITIDRLQAINSSLHFSFNVRPLSRQEKVAVSVLEGVVKKLAKKEIDKKRALKPFTISLKYYEAFYLKTALDYIMQFEHYNDLQIVMDILDQKLA